MSSKNLRPTSSTKLRGHPEDLPDVRISKTVSWLLRHAAQNEGLPMRRDGYLRVSDLLAHPKLQSLDFASLREMMNKDAKNRFDLLHKPETCEAEISGSTLSDVRLWWIRANQGHSMTSVELNLQPVLKATDISMAVHGTSRKAWESILNEGLSKMNRNHIHLAQGVARNSVVSGMRSSSQILIYIDVAKAMSAGIKFFLSSNGVVLTEGDCRGFLDPQFFGRVENARGMALTGWERLESTTAQPAVVATTDST